MRMWTWSWPRPARPGWWPALRIWTGIPADRSITSPDRLHTVSAISLIEQGRRSGPATVLLVGAGALAMIPLVAWTSPIGRMKTLPPPHEPAVTESVAEEMAG